MLTSEALNCAMPLTEVLDGRNIVLMPIQGSPLEALVNATRSDSNFVSDCGNSVYKPDVVNIEYIANCKDAVFKQSPHDLVMNDVTEVAIKAVQAQMNFARNVVAPVVSDLVARVTESLVEMTPSKLLGMEVIVWNPPKPMLNAAFETGIRKFEETPFENVTLSMRSPVQSADEIKELLKTGTAGLDRDIAEWAAVKGDSFFCNIWESIFQIKQAELNERTVIRLNDFVDCPREGLDNSIAIYLLARKLSDSPLPGTEMNLPAFQRLAADFRNQAAVRLCRAIDRMTENAKHGIMILSNTQNTTVVDGQLYTKWIESGGENEVLFGNLLEMPISVSIAQLNDKAEALKMRWVKHATLIATVENNRKFNKTKEVLSYQFEKQMRDIQEGDEASMGNRENIINAFGDLLDVVRESDFADLWSLCLKLVCAARFPRTNAEQILSGIDRIKKENPNADIRECAAISILEYAASWVASQMKVVHL